MPFEGEDTLKTETLEERVHKACTKIMSWDDYAAYEETRSHGEDQYSAGQLKVIDRPEKNLLFIGVPHAYQLPEEEQEKLFADIKSRFIKYSPDLVFVEGASHLNTLSPEELKSRYGSLSEDEAARRWGETGLVASLAIKGDIELKSPEPDDKDEIQNLLNKGFSKEDIFVKSFYMMFPQWAGGERNKAFQEYVEPQLKGFEEATQWEGFDYSYESAEALAKKAQGNDSLNLNDPAYYRGKIDPAPWSDKKEFQGVSNEISRSSSEFRDRYLVRKIAEALENKRKLFVVFGGSHAVMIEPALNKLLEN